MLLYRALSALQARCADDEGSHAIEYSLIAALVAMAIVVGTTALGGSLDGFFGDIATWLDGVPRPA